ncbi:ASCH domain-containing protein [Streptomyces sp. AD2-2]|nr:ASCH domain-containing protein [Streptomyces sp. AD2-2]
MTTARALTVRQPWAALIAAGLKPVENRSWALPASFAGPLLIHAGTKDDADGWAVPGVREALEGIGRSLAYGAIVAVVQRVTCHRAASCCADRWGEPGAWHWVLEDVRRLSSPIPATGRLSLWRPEPEAVVAALAAPQSAG